MLKFRMRRGLGTRAEIKELLIVLDYGVYGLTFVHHQQAIFNKSFYQIMSKFVPRLDLYTIWN